MHEEYFKLPTYDCKNQYLANLITRRPTKNQALYGTENKSRVAFNNAYRVVVEGNKVISV